MVEEEVGGGGRRRRLIYGNSVGRLKAHTAACFEQRRGGGWEKHGRNEGRSESRSLISDFEARDEARTALAFAIVLQG